MIVVQYVTNKLVVTIYRTMGNFIYKIRQTFGQGSFVNGYIPLKRIKNHNHRL